ncbi:hypothetical protein QS257_01620 [Terrilactibacillus sp. S3-3]|nr:hypothetical protein QS257_01620 [Terrilactibacillus sp. S3-3]
METKELVVDYTHMNDSVGNFSEFGAPIIGRQYFVKEKSESTLAKLSHFIPVGALYNAVIGGHLFGRLIRIAVTHAGRTKKRAICSHDKLLFFVEP